MPSSHRSKAQWLKLIHEQEQSGLNQKEFCKTKGINPKYFSLRRSKLIRSVPPSEASQSPFLKLTPKQDVTTEYDNTVVFKLGGVELQLHKASAQFIAELVKALA